MMMRGISIACVCVLTFMRFGIGQEPDVAFLRLINLISIDSPTLITFNGRELNKGKPVSLGEKTGVISLPLGKHRIKVENKGAKVSVVTINFELKAVASGLVLYAVSKEKKDGTIEFSLTHRLLEGRGDLDEPKLSVFSVSKKQDVDIWINGKQTRLRQTSPSRIALKMKETVGFSDGEKSIGEAFISAPVHYVAFIYDKLEDEGFGLTVYRHRKYIHQAPRSSFDD